jgi:hypothetical protein
MIVLVRLDYHSEPLPSGDRLLEVQPQRDCNPVVVLTRYLQTCEFKVSQTARLSFLHQFC